MKSDRCGKYRSSSLLIILRYNWLAAVTPGCEQAVGPWPGAASLDGIDNALRAVDSDAAVVPPFNTFYQE